MQNFSKLNQENVQEFKEDFVLFHFLLEILQRLLGEHFYLRI